MASEPLRDFVRYKDGRIAAVVRNDQAGGVFRGHVDIWFGAVTGDPTKPPLPVLKQVLTSDCEPINYEDLPTGQ